MPRICKDKIAGTEAVNRLVNGQTHNVAIEKSGGRAGEGGKVKRKHTKPYRLKQSLFHNQDIENGRMEPETNDLEGGPLREKASANEMICSKSGNCTMELC